MCNMIWERLIMSLETLQIQVRSRNLVRVMLFRVSWDKLRQQIQHNSTVVGEVCFESDLFVLCSKLFLELLL